MNRGLRLVAVLMTAAMVTACGSSEVETDDSGTPTDEVTSTRVEESSSASTASSALQPPPQGPAWGGEGLGEIGWDEDLETTLGVLVDAFGEPELESASGCAPSNTRYVWDELVMTAADDAGLQSYSILSAYLPSVWGFGLGATVGEAKRALPELTVTTESASTSSSPGYRWQWRDPATGATLWGYATGETDDDTLVEAVYGTSPTPEIGCTE